MGMTLVLTEIDPNATRTFSRACGETICGRSKNTISDKSL
jgi:hypothetical protein